MIVLIFAMLLCCGFICSGSVRVLFVSRLTAPASCAGSDLRPAGPEDRNNKRISNCRSRTARRRNARWAVRAGQSPPTTMINTFPFIVNYYFVPSKNIFIGSKYLKKTSSLILKKVSLVPQDIFRIARAIERVLQLGCTRCCRFSRNIA